MQLETPLVLIILDGWGYSEQISHNAIAKANTPFWDSCWQNAPHTLLEASGTPVGLPKSQMGNSEVGHMHIGAGRIIPQDFTRINQAIEDGSFETNNAFIQTIQGLKSSQNTLHIMGLLSPGGVHSHEEHLFAFLELCKNNNFDAIKLHLFLDGRDTPPKSAIQSIEKLEAHLTYLPGAEIASISGRFYAMDRDSRWERIEPVYQLLTTGHAEYHFDHPIDAIQYFYTHDISDEFIPPTAIGLKSYIQDSDAIFFFNFRKDRARELTEAFILPNFDKFQRQSTPNLSSFVSMTTYADTLETTVAFPPFQLEKTLGEILSDHQLTQLRIAETEKYAHVTFFLNGGLEHTFPLEERILIPSPKVSTYDLKPEMSALEITHEIMHAIEARSHDVIICNYANADMVGHTGDFDATIRAIECLDLCLSRIADALAKAGGQLLITADHGNAECMFNHETQMPHTAHTNYLVPLVYIGHNDLQFEVNHIGSLADIAPTILTLLGITPPDSMTGQALLSSRSPS